MGTDGQLAKNTEIEWPVKLKKNQRERVATRLSREECFKGEVFEQCQSLWKNKEDGIKNEYKDLEDFNWPKRTILEEW